MPMIGLNKFMGSCIVTDTRITLFKMRKRKSSNTEKRTPEHKDTGPRTQPPTSRGRMLNLDHRPYATVARTRDSFQTLSWRPEPATSIDIALGLSEQKSTPSVVLLHH